MDTGQSNSEISAREMEVARAYTGGKTYREIAADLNIAPATVRTHINNIYRKLDVSSKIELLRLIEPSAKQAPNVQTSQRAKISAPVFASVVAMISALAALTYMTRPATIPAPLAPPAPELHTVALVPFQHDGDEVARDTLIGELVSGLTQHTELFVVRSARLSGNKLPEAQARSLSRNISERFVLFGQVATGGAGLVVSAALYDARQDQVIWRKEARSAEDNSLALRLDLIDSLKEAVRLPDTREQTARCLEMLEYAGTDSTRPLYRFETDAPVYCRRGTFGPR